MVVLVTGANGQLGNEMRILATCHTELDSASDRYIFTDVNHVEGVETTYLDITNLEAIRAIVKENHVNIIVNCAAWTNVDGAEDPQKYELVEKLNATAPENLAKAMKEVDGLLVHISTDYVFGAELYNTPCKEDQTGTPTGVYGLTKLHGEQKIIDSGCKYVIIRTAWLYSEFGKNFVKTMMNLMTTKPELKVVFDQVGTPTYALDLAKVIIVVLKKFEGSQTGVYHYSSEGVCSWYDFTKMIQQIAVQLNTHSSELIVKCNIKPCYSSDFPSPVKRPSYSVLDKSKIKSVFGVEVPYWIDSLKDCLANLMAQNS